LAKREDGREQVAALVHAPEDMTRVEHQRIVVPESTARPT